MSRCPEYLKKKRKSYNWLILLFFVLFFSWWQYQRINEWKYLEEHSVFENKNFEGKVEEIIAPISGVRAYFMKVEDTPLAAISFVFENAGSAYDEKNKKGIAGLVSATLLDGAGKMSADKLRDEIGIKGIKISFNAGKDDIAGIMSAPNNNFDEGAKILADILSLPKFEKKYGEIAKKQILKALDVERENPNTELNLDFMKKIYDKHPYGDNPLGNKDDVLAINQNDLKKFVASKFGKNNLKVGIVGNIEKEKAKEILDVIFGKIADNVSVEDIEEPIIDWNEDNLIVDRNGGQNIASVAAKSTCRTCDDFYPLYIANYLFGGSGLNSRLNKQMREKEGLTYGGYSFLSLSNKSNLILAGFSATANNFETAKNIFMDEWKKVGENGFDEKELEVAKKYLRFSHNLRYASTIDIAEILMYMQKENLGLEFLNKRNEYVEAVSLTKLNDVARKYFNDDILIAVSGKF